VSERWQQVEVLYSEALKRNLPERAAFLQQPCAGDDGLRKGLESLLAEAEHASGFFSSRQLGSALRSVVESSAVEHSEESGTQRPPFFWFVIAAGIALLAFYICSGWVLYRNAGAENSGWWESFRSINGSIVGKVAVPGPAAGILLRGDRILAFNGDPAPRKWVRLFSCRLFDPAPTTRFVLTVMEIRTIMVSACSRGMGTFPKSLPTWL